MVLFDFRYCKDDREESTNDKKKIKSSRWRKIEYDKAENQKVVHNGVFCLIKKFAKNTADEICSFFK